MRGRKGDRVEGGHSWMEEKRTFASNKVEGVNKGLG